MDLRFWEWFTTPSRPAFYCRRHWRQMKRLGADPEIVAIGVTLGLFAADYPPQPVRRACCLYQQSFFDRIVERAIAAGEK